MKKLFVSLLIGLLFLPAGICFADTEDLNTKTYYKPTLMDKIEDSTLDFAESVGDATTDAARKSGAYIKDKSKTAASATNKAVKKGAKATGEAVKSGAKKAGNATKNGAIKATNWSAKKVRNGAEKIILKTEEVNATQATPEVEE